MHSRDVAPKRKETERNGKKRKEAEALSTQKAPEAPSPTILGPVTPNVGEGKRCTSPRNGKKRLQTEMKRQKTVRAGNETETNGKFG